MHHDLIYLYTKHSRAVVIFIYIGNIYFTMCAFKFNQTAFQFLSLEHARYNNTNTYLPRRTHIDIIIMQLYCSVYSAVAAVHNNILQCMLQRETVSVYYYHTRCRLHGKHASICRTRPAKQRLRILYLTYIMCNITRYMYIIYIYLRIGRCAVYIKINTCSIDT